MPKEDRLITFDFDEAYEALAALCKQKDIQDLFQGEITGMSHPDGDSSRILIQFKNPETKQGHSEEYSRDFIAAALMLFCRNLKIPLPRGGKKFVSFDDDEVMLRITVFPQEKS